MKTNYFGKALITITVLALVYVAAVRVAEYQKSTTLAEREARASLSAERALGLRPAKFVLPGSQAL